MNRVAVIFGVIAVITVGYAAQAQDSITPTAAVAPSTPAAAITDTVVQGAGTWNTDGTDPNGVQRWALNVVRNDDNTISGRVSVASSPLLNNGNVQGKIDGPTVSGTIMDDNGNQLATFTGAVTGSGMRGKYTDQTGETGDWEWDAPLPN